ncbi:L-threonylcarbamoyladenylate synthase [Pirellulales bacterium]|nr:L-threonylcarbamoyladenylate synthase [Pirellulales bacterium]
MARRSTSTVIIVADWLPAVICLLSSVCCHLSAVICLKGRRLRSRDLNRFMPPQVIHLRKTADRRDVVHRAVEALAAGQLVVFPTETVYGLAAAALNADAVDRLARAKGRPKDVPFSLAMRSCEDAYDYITAFGSGVAGRLARRCWPGPVTLVVEHGQQEGLISQLPSPVRDAVAPNGTVGIRVPAHPTLLDVLRMTVGPLVLTSANPSGQPPAAVGSEAAEMFPDDVALVLDDGPCRYSQPSTVVRADEVSWQCLREGVVPLSAIERLSQMLILLVCTGNTCRSPMAEALMRKTIADRLQLDCDDDNTGVIVASAGVSASAGCAASPEAVEVMKQSGLDISGHSSQPLTDKLVQHADVIYTLTGVHRQAIVHRWPESASRTFNLRSDNGDVDDPIGGGLDTYQRCASQIEAAIRGRVAEMPLKQQ